MSKTRLVVCQVCGKSFEANSRTRTCNDCIEREMKRLGKPVNICMNCGSRFHARFGAKYCSDSCRQAAYRKNKDNQSNVTNVSINSATNVTNQLTDEEWKDVKDLTSNLLDITWKHSENMANSFKKDYLLNESEGKSHEIIDKESKEIYNHWFEKCNGDSFMRMVKLVDYLKKLGMPE